MKLPFYTIFSSLENWTSIFFRGFLVCHQVVVMTCSPPQNLSSGGFEHVMRSGEDNYQDKIQYSCHEPYYKIVPAMDNDQPLPGTFTDSTQHIWKDRERSGKIPQCLPVCGKPSTPIDQDQRALVVSKAKLGSFPWQALIFIYGRGGGALLADRWILTAAHTIYPKDSFFQKNHSVDVFLGHTDVEEIIRLGAYSVRRVIVHPDYRPEDSDNFEGDIALLELENSVPLGSNILPICLPDNETLYASGLVGYVSGFGMERGRLVSQLKYVRLPVAKREACEAWLLEKNRTEVFSPNMFCAGDRTLKQGVCQGDSGGVFAVWDNTTERWMATGIVSWGTDCSKGYGFYTKVLNYMDWIKGIMEGEA
ncbi:complement C1r subcomponent-like protein [Dromiciops gliroides]|uniref:complement C1r subcomponent-like protein n=1 Tax=Dromiciops gliroides TaxID=33562 RepID=UPI001CC42577|nr:complement C1r subcomponent-like protein [Dromiciops gliroides]XP_043821774.1 complement C1r subcomponent-like protein [Dromiciops gliroides]XP_043821775.1 complement C1r subcomponent-like protein [Dromiciops gliroides]XP_043821776.1 complement C1r subcomponent-like protein [Dromiciops gliroides]XP_043821777.1 complement C1r subcomponent-like protein [Dromiciops gliroides]XP_043821779.1 complement C1r subcomponent-like protein [Dromiciops gliroides]XP_043821780.1 complement C1r subcomponen